MRRGAGEEAEGFLPARPPVCVLGGGFSFGSAVDFGGRGAVVRAVRAVFVVEAKVALQLRVGVDERVVAFEVNLLVFDSAPESFDEHVV